MKKKIYYLESLGFNLTEYEVERETQSTYVLNKDYMREIIGTSYKQSVILKEKDGLVFNTLEEALVELEQRIAQRIVEMNVKIEELRQAIAKARTLNLPVAA